MPSFQDSIFLAVLALLLFGPKKLPELARYLGKMMAEFRRASNEFRMQMEDEFRVIEQAEQQKKIAALEAAQPLSQPGASLNLPEPEHPHLPPPMEPAPEIEVPEHSIATSEPAPEPVAIASSGDLRLMPPSTGLPISRSAGSSSLSGIFDAIPHAPEASTEPEASHNA